MKKNYYILGFMIIMLCIIGINKYYLNNDYDNRISKVVIDSGGGGGSSSKCSRSNCAMCVTSSTCANAGCRWNNNTCSAPTPVPTVVTPTVSSVDGGGTIYIAADESATFSFTAISNPANASNFTPQWGLNINSGVSSSSSNGATYSFTTSGGSAGTGANCAKTSYTITATAGGKSATATATVCKYCSAWKGPFKANILSKTKRNTSKPEKGCYYYEGEEKVDGGWKYSSYYSRCCTPPSSDFGACYGDKEYLGIATSVDWQIKESNDRPYKYPNVKQEDCHKIDVNICKISPVGPNGTKTYTDKCEESKNISYQDKTICSNSDGTEGTNFYTITCDRSVSTKFDYGNDNNTNTSRILHKGQGFEYGITVTSVHTCTAIFNQAIWKEVYDKFLTKIKYIDSSLTKYVENYDYDGWYKAVNNLKSSDDTKKEVFALWNDLKELRKIVLDEYLNYKPANNYDEKATITLTYDISGKSTIFKDELISSEDDFKEGEYTRTYSGANYYLTKQLKKIPEKLIITNATNPRVVKLIPKHVYIDKYLGKGINNDISNVDGGNKIYTDYNIDPTKNGKLYPINIEVSGLGSNNSIIYNNKCNIEILDEEVTYRPIDVSNPFINSNWEIGKNWLNNRFSFTNTIKSDIWSFGSLLNIELDNNFINEIKESNKNYSDKYPYLGLCERINSANQDPTTKKLCSMLKNY